MNRNDEIKRFIQDFNSKIRYMTGKKIFREYFLRGSFKQGFRLMFRSNPLPEYCDYYFKLDSEDIEYLRKKYLPQYHEILEQEKELDKEKTIQKIHELQDKLKKIKICQKNSYLMR